MGAKVKRETRRARFQAVQERSANVDRASRIPPQWEAAELRRHGLGTDFCHLSEKVYRARLSLVKPGSRDAACGLEKAVGKAILTKV